MMDQNSSQNNYAFVCAAYSMFAKNQSARCNRELEGQEMKDQEMKEGVPLTRPNHHQYKLDPKGRCFRTGLTVDGKQVLIGIWFPYLVAVFFDQNGNLLDAQERRLSADAQKLAEQGFFTERPQKQFEQELQLFMNEINCRSSHIVVKKFAIPRHSLRIEDYPRSFQEVVSDPGRHSQEDVNDARESLHGWWEEGLFVFEWGNEYWVNRDGEFVAS
jgi:hypothetical protein